MIKFNGTTYSGSVVHSDENSLIVTIRTVDTLQDICENLNNVKSVSEIANGIETVYEVNTAVSVASTSQNIFTISFTKKPTPMQEMNNAIDALLIMALGGKL